MQLKGEFWGMIDIIFDTLKDGIRVLPFLWGAFLIIELLEHKFSNNNLGVIEKSGRLGPFIGGLLGAVPQCGFSLMATNLYVARIITMGTLISIYLSTSDEMLPIMLAHGSDIFDILKVLGIKVVVGIISGIVIDYFVKRKNDNIISEFCKDEHCHCENGIFKSSFIHAIRTLFFIILVSFFLNLVMYYGGDDFLRKLVSSNNVVILFISGLVGLIPNCASSVVLTELYLNGILSLAGVVSGLLTASGVGMLVLFKTNKNLKENLKILVLVYLIGVLVGLLLELFS